MTDGKMTFSVSVVSVESSTESCTGCRGGYKIPETGSSYQEWIISKVIKFF